jgi:hypothetical protein
MAPQPRSPVGDLALIVDRAEVAPRRHVAGLEGDADPQCLDDPPTDDDLHGVEAEEAEVPGSTARRDPRWPRVPREARPSRLGVAAASSSVPASPLCATPPQAIRYEQEELGLVFHRELLDELASRCIARRDLGD